MESNQDNGQVADTERGELIEKMVLDIMHRQNLTKMLEVVANLKKLDKYLSTEEIHDAARRLERSGEINLSEDKISSSFFRNLADIEANAPFWIPIIACSILLFAAFVLPQDESGLTVMRIASAAFLFVIPGYVTTNVFIARNRLSYIERIAISVGLSLAIVAIVGIVLAYGIAGINLQAIVVSLTGINIIMAFLGSYQDFIRRHKARDSHSKFLGERKIGGGQID